ncbi:RDD family protein [Microbulbifer epialgicus]|uniref:RDD family protein n=1 Tax=Microbulbifer epialgicus TaxID=393907 RepID=A0ABV4NXQ2_9GAMM
MNPWEILEIDPCNDTRTIKRAYAKQLKQTRPDEKPEEFQQLHTAYKWALKLAEEMEEDAAPREICDYENGAEAEMREATISEHQLNELNKDSSLSLEESTSIRGSANEMVVQSVEATDESPTESTKKKESSRQELTTSTQPVSEEALENQCESEYGQEESTVEELYQEENDPERERKIAEYHKVLGQVGELLQNPREINVEKNWHFLTDTPYMLDEEYNWNLGLSIFEGFARFNQQAIQSSSKGKDQVLIPPNILHYCNGLFDWSGNVSHLYSALDEELCEVIFSALQNDTLEMDPLQGLRGGRKVVRKKVVEPTETYDQYYFGHLLARGIAVLLDLLLIYVAVGFISSIVIMKVYKMPESAATTISLGGCCLLYLVMAWIAESSKFQATPGKYLMGYKVTNKKFERIGYGHGLWRVLSFTLTLLLGKIAWLINCFLGGNLMHDRLSSSHVINMRKSREEYLRRLRGEE